MKNAKGIFTNSNCIGCNKCISECPIQDCIGSKIINGGNEIWINKELCVNCAQCIDVCNHDAIDYYDDTDRFLTDLNKGAQIVLAVDPAFYINYPNQAMQILAYLKNLGVSAIYNVSVGNDIALWAMCHWLRKHPNEFSIVTNCSTVIEYLRRCKPELLENVVPVRRGYACLVTYLRKYCGEKRRIAYLSPCMSVSAGSKLYDGGAVEYNVTFKHLLKQIESSLDNYDLENTDVQIDLDDFAGGSLFAINGALKRSLEFYIGTDRPIFDIYHVALLFSNADDNAKLLVSSTPSIAVLANCVFGCARGTGVDKEKIRSSDIFNSYAQVRQKVFSASMEFGHNSSSPEKRFEWLNEHFVSNELDVNDFYFTIEEKYKEPFVIPEDVYNEVFNSMHKMTERSRHIDCHACGYETCREMAEVIAKGYNQIENCVEYERYENNRILTTSSITNLPNMQMFNQCIQEIIDEKTSKEFSAIRVHIKNLGLINELFSFDTGSKLLAEFAKSVLKCLLPNEKLFHSNGANFYAIIENEHINKFIFSVNHLSLSADVIPEDFPGISCRCGIYVLTGKETKVETVINCVNSAYARAKKTVANDIVYYNSELNKSMIKSLMISQQLPSALADNEFMVVFQPKVSVEDHILIGAEALIRWNHDGKIVSPSEFISISETTGFIKRIDFFMLTEVCKNIAMWRDIGVDIKKIRVSINFSKGHFSQSGISERICSIVDMYNIPHKCIEIEITESSFLEELDNIKQGLDELRANGISTSIDDFGTGYSSISLLQSLHFDVIKFDKTFIDTVVKNTRAEIVMRDIVHMAKDLKMEVVAEGVEDWEKLELMQSLGCDIIQGYVFDKPLIPQEFLKRLIQHQYA